MALQRFKSLGLIFASVKGWIIVVSLAPAAVTAVLGWMEGTPKDLLALYITGALTCGVLLAWGGMGLFERANSYFTTRAEKNRIKKQIEEYGSSMLDTPTAAAIWAGTLDPANLSRHLRFRAIKADIDAGMIKGAVFSDKMRKANKDSKIPLDEFAAYLKNKGALD